MNISICYVDTKNEIHEDTIGFIQLPDTAQSLFAVMNIGGCTPSLSPLPNVLDSI